MNIPGYDAWRLAGPDEAPQVGTEGGDTCNRYPEPDEDQPRNYRPRRRNGVMQKWRGETACDTCGELA
jgi:hypothetical protein